MTTALCDFETSEAEDGGFRQKCKVCGYTKTVPTRRYVRKCSQRRPTANPTPGPGTELKRMLEEIDARAHIGCGCESMVKQMNRWGIEGCRKNRDEIAATLQKNAGHLRLLQLFTMAGRVRSASWANKINPLSPFRSLVDEAIRRSAEKGQVQQ